MRSLLICTGILMIASVCSAQQPRERIRLDDEWQFAFGHPSNAKQDFEFGTGYFSYLAKAGYGDGASAFDFDDSEWRTINLPHDWAVEAPFENNGNHSQGYKAVGRNFPERSVGWYRKKFTVPETDNGRRVVVEFDGVFRDAKVFCNGFYLGTEPSGYIPFRFDLTDYLNFGGDNVIAVRVDATMEEGRSDEPRLHITPSHWNWADREEQLIPICVYANTDAVELFLNGKTLGRKPMPHNGYVNWNVPFESGQIEARSFNSDGEVVLTKTIETVGEPVRIELVPHRNAITADGRDVSVVTVRTLDDNGHFSPTANDLIAFKMEGPGRIIGVGNGDPSSHEPDKFIDPASVWQRSLFHGLAQVIVQSSGEPGVIRLSASGPGLRPTELEIQAD
ncbi:sugar-binding domain-containing protein [Planctomycetes bacterium CA13]|uniref:sugar-binding domain-containing protein n=1 Tax=Novipirellula herctigrandis TaxID=2527986 RepID=UPI0011B435F8